MVDQETGSVERSQTGVGCLVRFLWMAAGNMVLAFSLVFIIQRHGFEMGPFDALFAFTVVVLVGARWLDIARLNGQTIDGQPATLAVWRRYALRLVVLAGVLWAVAKLVAGFALPG